MKILTILTAILAMNVHAEVFHAQVAKSVCNPTCGDLQIVLDKDLEIPLNDKVQTISIFDGAKKLQFDLEKEAQTNNIVIDSYVGGLIGATFKLSSYNEFRQVINYTRVTEANAPTWYILVLNHPAHTVDKTEFNKFLK